MDVALTIFALVICCGSVYTAEHGGICSSSVECPGAHYECRKSHPSCAVTVCLCEDGYHLRSGVCQKVVKLGESCTAESACMPTILTTCSTTTNTCVCGYGMTEIDRQCVTGNQSLSESCMDHGDCRGFSASPVAVRCVSGTCGCETNQVEDAENDACHYPKEGDSCSIRSCGINYNCASNSTCYCRENYREIVISATFSEGIHRYGKDSVVLPTCVPKTANTDVAVGGQCELPSGESDIMKVCKTTLDCEYCSTTGPYVCVQVSAENTLTTDVEHTTRVSNEGGSDVTTTAGAASGSRSVLMILPTVLWMKLF